MLQQNYFNMRDNYANMLTKIMLHVNMIMIHAHVDINKLHAELFFKDTREIHNIIIKSITQSRGV